MRRSASCTIIHASFITGEDPGLHTFTFLLRPHESIRNKLYRRNPTTCGSLKTKSLMLLFSIIGLVYSINALHRIYMKMINLSTKIINFHFVMSEHYSRGSCFGKQLRIDLKKLAH